MSDDRLQTFLTRENAEAQQREEAQRQRAEVLDRRQRLGEALRPLLELLPLSGPAATRTPYDDRFRNDLCDALLTVGAAMQNEGVAPTVTELSVASSAHGYALGLLQKAAAADAEGIAGALEELATLPERSRQDVWDEHRNLAEQLLSGWLDRRRAMEKALSSETTETAGRCAQEAIDDAKSNWARRGKWINERMLVEMKNDPTNALKRSLRAWADVLDCAPSTVQATVAWGELEKVREGTRLAKAMKERDNRVKK
jgi:hypothetical protein